MAAGLGVITLTHVNTTKWSIMSEKFVLAIDQGTTSSRAIVFNHEGKIVGSGQEEHEQIFPRAGWVEHDPLEIWVKVQKVVDLALADAGKTKDDIVAVGITNQRETTVVWNKETGQPVYNAIVWQDTRTGKIVEELGGGNQDKYKERVGLPLATYFCGPKVKWILDNVPGARDQAEGGKLVMGTIDSWVIWNLNGGVNVTDVTNASRTMLMDLTTLSWDAEIAADMTIPMSMLPEIKSSAEVYGTAVIPSLAGIPVAGDLGDQQAATFGQACFEPGMAKNTYGTGNFMILNTGTEIVPSKNGLLTTLCYKIGDTPPIYALEGAIAVTGSHIARAVLEATAFQTREVLDAMNADSGVPLTELKVDGGMTANNLLMQFQADVLGVPVVRPVVAETTALGAAYAAGIATGFWNGEQDVIDNWAEDKRWSPAAHPNEIARVYRNWKKAVTKTFDWVDADVKE